MKSESKETKEFKETKRNFLKLINKCKNFEELKTTTYTLYGIFILSRSIADIFKK